MHMNMKYAPVYSWKHIVRGDFLIFSSNKSLLVEKQNNRSVREPFVVADPSQKAWDFLAEVDSVTNI